MKNLEIVIRRAHPHPDKMTKDAAILLRDNLRRLEKTQKGKFDRAFFDDYMRDYVGRPCRIAVGYHEGVLATAVCFAFRDVRPEEELGIHLGAERVAEVALAATHPDFRRDKAATELLDAVRANVAAAGADHLYVSAPTEEGRPFWESLGCVAVPYRTIAGDMVMPLFSERGLVDPEGPIE